jgi:rare lipoprotein A (peptidoglycan hydrolase)
LERRIIQPRPAHRRPRRRSDSNLSGPRPDLVAAWAVALGIFLILVASATSQGATDSTGGAKAPPPQPAKTGAAPAAPDKMTRDALESLRAELGLDADVASADSQRAIVRRMRFQRATWYGPGFYGRRTACGVKLRPWTVGVAHRRLPCGTRVTFFHGGTFKTVPVIDRGPFAGATNWDLTAAAARALDFRATGRLRVIH